MGGSLDKEWYSRKPRLGSGAQSGPKRKQKPKPKTSEDSEDQQPLVGADDDGKREVKRRMDWRGDDIIDVLEKQRKQKTAHKLGKGAYGAVYQVEMDDGKGYAVKVMTPSGDDTQKFYQHEIVALKEFQSDCEKNHLVCFKDAQERVDPKHGIKQYYIITDLVRGKVSLESAWDRIRRGEFLTPQKLETFLRTFLMAMWTIRQHRSTDAAVSVPTGWAHNDMAMRNVLIHEGTGAATVVDMGMASPVGSEYQEGMPRSNLATDRKAARDIAYDLLQYTFDTEDKKRAFIQSLDKRSRDYLLNVYYPISVPLLPKAVFDQMTFDILEGDISILGLDMFQGKIEKKFMKDPEKRASLWFARLLVYFRAEDRARQALKAALKRKGSNLRRDVTSDRQLKVFFRDLYHMARASEIRNALERLDAMDAVTAERMSLLELNPDVSPSLLDENEVKSVPELSALQPPMQQYELLHQHALPLAHTNAMLLLAPDGQYVASLFFWPSVTRPGYLQMSTYTEAPARALTRFWSETELALLRAVLTWARDKGFHHVVMDASEKLMEMAFRHAGIPSDGHEYVAHDIPSSLARLEAYMNFRLLHVERYDDLGFHWPWEGKTDHELAEMTFDKSREPTAIQKTLTDERLAAVDRRHPYWYLAPEKRGQKFLVPHPSKMWMVEGFELQIPSDPLHEILRKPIGRLPVDPPSSSDSDHSSSPPPLVRPI